MNTSQVLITFSIFIMATFNLPKMTIYTKDDTQTIQNAKFHQDNIQKVLDAKKSKVKLTLMHETKENAKSLRFEPKTQIASFLSSKSLETQLRPRFRTSGLNDQEIDVIFGFFFQNFIVPQMTYEALLASKKATTNTNFYLGQYENVLFAYHYWMDQSTKTDQKQVQTLVKKVLEKVKNPVGKKEIFSIYIAENKSIIDSDLINWLYLQSYILNDITEYVEHTSFGDFIGYLLADLK
ncbi:MAG TPA: hypothetical protein PKD85_09790 [Saprospiraceae bacterium]|nr:hypothetical protein [Saprospiraceae bacterium]